MIYCVKQTAYIMFSPDTFSDQPRMFCLQRYSRREESARRHSSNTWIFRVPTVFLSPRRVDVTPTASRATFDIGGVYTKACPSSFRLAVFYFLSLSLSIFLSSTVRPVSLLVKSEPNLPVFSTIPPDRIDFRSRFRRRIVTPSPTVLYPRNGCPAARVFSDTFRSAAASARPGR